jgi:hypothetical protein
MLLFAARITDSAPVMLLYQHNIPTNPHVAPLPIATLLPLDAAVARTNSNTVIACI